jgi:hypothetical protein
MNPNRVSAWQLAHVLALIGDPPNRRRIPRPGNLEGDFTAWFDGGAIREVAGYTDYHLSDGTVASVGVLPWLEVNLEFAGGERASVRQYRPPPQSPERQRSGSDFRFCIHCGARSDHAMMGPRPQAFVCRACGHRTVPQDPLDTLRICRFCGSSMYPGRYCPWCGRP